MPTILTTAESSAENTPRELSTTQHHRIHPMVVLPWTSSDYTPGSCRVLKLNDSNPGNCPLLNFSWLNPRASSTLAGHIPAGCPPLNPNWQQPWGGVVHPSTSADNSYGSCPPPEPQLTTLLVVVHPNVSWLHTPLEIVHSLKASWLHP